MMSVECDGNKQNYKCTTLTKYKQIACPAMGRSHR